MKRRISRISWKRFDAALERMDDGTYGLCDLCHEPVETDRLIADPLTRLCIGHLTPGEQRALEEDLELASRIQHRAVARCKLPVDGWEVAYHYQPAGLVSGDYCDLMGADCEGLHFIVGDVSGKVWLPRCDGPLATRCFGRCFR